ncbi:SRPBCC family protein [Actinophytocola oryzae]|uniref:Polyketide cyclase/dehydrase/lipid transport protein n=1 Tax=Actinophytocola oryzae TaxID=502181 RepID=A0A4R7VKC8_9PSEU|nr:SRPBCC family protein [Actinophytocola oryzae]TDV49912.1 polyketide cyclase/dehydrase/lipid transport protein [Actinophytocola oryzae]
MRIRPHPEEVAADLPGDDLVPDAEVVMDRGFDLPAPPADVWPWFAQLGRNRAGWYLPRAVECLMPPRTRALRHLEESLQHLSPGDIIDDWGGRDATFEIVTHDPPGTLVHRSTRGAMHLSWAITLRPTADGTRVHLRLRLAGVRRRRLAEYGGGFVDLVTVAGLAVGLRERLAQ